MKRWWLTLLLITVPFGNISSAKALCIYGGKHFEKSKQSDFHGRLYAKTTLADEFADSALVVRGTVLSSRDIGLEHQDSDEGWGTVYSVRVDEVFKGAPSKIILDYSSRDSGGFYPGEGGDSREYLLFLVPMKRNDWAQKIVPDAFEVNYSCGQSRQWREVSERERQVLGRLSNSQNRK